jgi:ABC-2 type transport system permease protein
MNTPAETAVMPVIQTSIRHRPTWLAALVWEVNKLAAQSRARWTLFGSLIGPILLVLVLKGQQRPPKDSLFGRHIHETGWAMPLLVLVFAAQWLLPLLTALVAGDIFAHEDQHGTWKTVLTRSVSRGQLFWAKTVTAALFALATLFVLGASTIISSILIIGHQDLPGLSGQMIPSARAAGLVIESWAVVAPPMLGFTCLAILLSLISRNSAVGIAAPVVIGMVMQLVGSLGAVESVRPYLLTTAFESWHGLLAQDQFFSPLTTGLLVSAVWGALCLGVSYLVLQRRDITGG